MAQDIFLTEIATKRKLQFPSLPQEVRVSSETSYASYDILDLGEVQFPNGSVPDRVDWEGIFFGASRKDMPFMRKWAAPSTTISILKQWKEKKAPLKLVVTGTPINIDVTISNFEYTPTGGDGDYNYSLVFIQYSDENVTVTKVQKSAPKPSKRPSSRGNTYTVKSGDTLWGIAQSFYRNAQKWTTIYNANKEIIESTARKRWKAKGINRGSQNGHWIFPGTVLKIP